MSITLTTIDGANHSIGIKDSGGDELAIAADGSIAITDNGGSLTVDAVDLDIRDLTHVSDSVKVGDGTDFLAIDASGNIGVTDAGGSLTVDAVDLDIRDLTHASDSVKIGDGTEFLEINADGSINATVQDPAFDTWKATNFSVTTTASDVTATPLALRKRVVLSNEGNQDVWIGEDGTVTTATGTKIPKGGSGEFDFGAVANIFALTGSATSDLRVLEFAA